MQPSTPRPQKTDAEPQRSSGVFAKTGNFLRSSSAYYWIISIGLTIMVTINMALLIWLLSQFNLAVEQLDHWPHSFHLIGSLLIDGQMNVQRIASPMDYELLIRSTSGLVLTSGAGFHQKHEQIYHGDWNEEWPKSVPSLSLTPDRIHALVGNHFSVFSANDDRLLMLLDQNGLKIFLDQVEIRSTPSMQNRIISLRNDSVQMNQINAQTETNHLTMISHTNRIRLRGTRQLQMQANHGRLMVNGKDSIKITSNNGKIILNATNIRLDHDSIKTIVASFRGRTYLTVAQLCVCANNGRLFMAPEDDAQQQHHHHHYYKYSAAKQSMYAQNRPCNRLAHAQCADQ